MREYKPRKQELEPRGGVRSGMRLSNGRQTMKRSLLLAGAAVALALTVTPSVAQDRTGLSKQDRAVERQGNSNEPARRESETTRDRSTNAQAPSESTEQTTPKRDQESSGGS